MSAEGTGGSWRNEELDRHERLTMVHHTLRLLQQKLATNTSLLDKLPLLAKRAEDELYRNARSREAYNDLTTLKDRIKALGPSLLEFIQYNDDMINKNEEEKKEGHSKIENNEGGKESENTNDRKDNGAASAPKMPTKEEHLKMQQNLLMWLRHASRCTIESDVCPAGRHCKPMKQIWNHIKTCREQLCTVPHCHANKALLSHYQNCLDAACQICFQVRAAKVRERSQEEVRNMPPVKRMKLNEDIYSNYRANRQNGGGEADLGLNDEIPESKVRPLPDISSVSQMSSLTYSMTKTQIRSFIKYLRISTPFFTHQKLKLYLTPLLEAIIEAEHGWVFSKPVDPQSLGLNDYNEVVKEPMDLGTVKKNLNAGFYTTPEEFAKDVKLTFENSILYNKEGSDLAIVAQGYMDSFVREFERLNSKFIAQKERILNEDELSCHPNSSTCSLCRGETFTFDPQVFYCNGRCKHKIRRGASFYTDETNKLHFCTGCYSELPTTATIVEGISVSKKKLRKGKNDDVSEEPWVQCDTEGCEEWTHQICALFNGRRNESKDLKFICPKCVLFHLQHTNSEGPLVPPTQRAMDLAENECSKFLQSRCQAVIDKDRERRAKNEGKELSEIEEVSPILIRVVSSADLSCTVKPLFSKMFKNTSFPKEFPYRSKAIILFQELHGVETIIFAMYVQEYGDDAYGTNKRSVYISYLDSVKYFSPSELRSPVFQEIVIGYMHYAKNRGFVKCYIWACPPMKGDDYILYAHPEEQKTPKADRLRRWYTQLIEVVMKDGVVCELTNLFDCHMVSVKEGEDMALALPYMEGDYWPGVAEDIIGELDAEGKKDRGTNVMNFLKNLKRPMTLSGPFKKKVRVFEGRRAVDDGDDEGMAKTPLMTRICEIIEPMKDDFIVCKFYHQCNGCSKFITNGVGYNLSMGEGRKKEVHICNICFANEEKLPVADRWSWLRLSLGETFHKFDFPPISISVVDPDPPIKCDFFNTRQSFLELCQGNHYQFDFLRRAMHSSMMSLYHIHNPLEPSFIHSCNICSLEIKTGFRFNCSICPDFDICHNCQATYGHLHPLTPINVTQANTANAYHNTNTTEKQIEDLAADRQKQLKIHIDLLVHSSTCQLEECSFAPNCLKMKQLLHHGLNCKVGVNSGCKLCARVWGLLKVHAINCTLLDCKVPHCIATLRPMILARNMTNTPSSSLKT